MKHRLAPMTIVTAGALLWSAACFSAGPEPAAAKEVEPEKDAKDKEWRDLFNGKDLTGWQSSKGGLPGKGWVAENEALVRKGGGGYIWTKERFGDFALDLEVTTKGNSGIFFRTDNIRDPVQTGIEMQVLPKGGPGKKNGFAAIYNCLAPSKEVGKPFGEWSRVTLTCNDNRITVEIDGEKVIDMDLDKWNTPRKNPDGSGNKFRTALKDFKREGHIGFQDHGAPVKYRNIRIKPLRKKPRNGKATTGKK
jgi:hypothetical protein